MVIQSPYPGINILELDILTCLFDTGENLPENPLWINAADTSQYLSQRTGLRWIKRLAIGLDRLSVKNGEVVMIVMPNHIFVPVAYLGSMRSGRMFSGANPLYTADGKWICIYHIMLQKPCRGFESARELDTQTPKGPLLLQGSFNAPTNAAPLKTSSARLCCLKTSAHRARFTFIADHNPIEMSFQIQNTGARIVLVHPSLLETARKAAKTARIPEN